MPRLRRRNARSALAARWVIPPLALALIACRGDGGSSGGESSTVRDSAGVRIVENRAPAWPTGSEWRVSDEPTLSIGETEGDSMLLLSRVFSGTRLSNGEIVVADGGSNQLRWFDASGAFIRAAGREGEGPGEFTFLNRVWRLPGDTVVATDLTPRLSRFSADGEYLDATTVMPPAGIPRVNVIGLTDDGHYLAMAGRGMSSEDRGRVLTDSLQLIRLSPGGADGGTFTRVRAQERWGLESGGQVSFPFLPFSSPASYTTGPDLFASGDGRSGLVTIWNTDGTHRRIIRWATRPGPVTDELRARYREDRLEAERDPNGVRRAEKFLAEAPTPDSLPVYQSLMVDATGTLWVEEFRPSWDRDPVWQLFAPDGVWLGAVRTPPRFRIFEIGPDYLLGRWLDDDNVERVRMYALQKPS